MMMIIIAHITNVTVKAIVVVLRDWMLHNYDNIVVIRFNVFMSLLQINMSTIYAHVTKHIIIIMFVMS